MDQNIITLIIEIKYENILKKIETEQLLTYDELKSKVIELFNIDENNKKNIVFTYLDEEGDTNILDFEENNLITIAKELIDDNYLVQLNLMIINNKNNNIIKYLDNKDIILENKEEEIDLIKNDNVKEGKKDEEMLKLKEREKIENQLKYKLRELYKRIIDNMKNKNIEIINELNFSLMNKIEQLSFINKKDESNIINLNDKEILNEKDNEIEHNETQIENYFINNSKLIAKDKPNLDFTVIEKFNTDIKDKIKVFEEIKEIVKKIPKKETLIKASEKIYQKMINNDIDIKELNDYFKSYLSRKDKQNIRKEFIILLEQIYKYIEICKINQINLNFFEKEKSKKKEEDIILVEENDYKNILDILVDTTKFKEELLNNLNNKATIK